MRGLLLPLLLAQALLQAAPPPTPPPLEPSAARRRASARGVIPGGSGRSSCSRAGLRLVHVGHCHQPAFEPENT